MKAGTLIYSGFVVLLTSGLGACSRDVTSPLPESSVSEDRSTAGTVGGRSGSTPTTTARPDTARKVCRADGELTDREIAQVRALYNAYLASIADDLRLIDAVNQEARAAAQAGATRDEIAAILARADAAQSHVAEATRRLRAAIAEILHDDRMPCFAVVPVIAGG